MAQEYKRLTKRLTKDEFLKLMEKPQALIQITEFFEREGYTTYDVYQITEDFSGKIGLFYADTTTEAPREQMDDVDKILELLNTMIQRSKTHKTIDVVFFYSPKLKGHRTRAPAKKCPIKVDYRRMI